MEALAGVQDACTDVGTAIVVTEAVYAGAEETGSTELSKLFLVSRGCEHQTNKSAKKWCTLANQKAKQQAKAEQTHEAKSAQQLHNYACPQ